MGQLSQSQDLGAGLKSRHVTMLSIAGVIGASLFVGSSVAIAEAGPAVLLAYLFAGLLVVMIMRMLAEMAVATPDTGSFSTYADKAIGRWAGYTIGWLYWWFWVLVIPLEANIAAIILHSWVPGVPVWSFMVCWWIPCIRGACRRCILTCWPRGWVCMTRPMKRCAWSSTATR